MWGLYYSLHYMRSFVPRPLHTRTQYLIKMYMYPENGQRRQRRFLLYAYVHVISLTRYLRVVAVQGGGEMRRAL